MSWPSPAQFVARQGNGLAVNGRPFRFLGGNAYYLASSAARGDTASVAEVFAMAQGLRMTVVRTWAFNDGADSLDSAVIQYRPGVFNETALRGLDRVLCMAARYGIRLILPLVNSWDEFGGMNQYVRWLGAVQQVQPGNVPSEIVRGEEGRQYRRFVSTTAAHDDFYYNPTIRSWFENYAAMLVNRVNSCTGRTYRDDTTIAAWELANEPRSSDKTGRLVRDWLDVMGSWMQALDPNHLVGSGEEGFDVTAMPYRQEAYGGQDWMFDGTAGISFSLNVQSPLLDFASVHLYPASWGIPGGAGGDWIRDHLRIASSSGTPLVIGEFGVRALQVATYDSWLATATYDGAAGALAWQLLTAGRTDPEGYGFRCPDAVCSVLRAYGGTLAGDPGQIPLPTSLLLRQNYPNPFNGQTTIAYALPYQAHVVLDVWTATGEHCATLVDGVQGAGERKELLEARGLASGAYFYRLRVGGTGGAFSATRRLIVLH
ncbi:MAG: cellulase family glycosylhydrolase [Bacteroidota bacterium]